MLTVNVDKLAAKLPEHRNGYGCAVETADVFSVPIESSVDYQHTVLAVNSVFVKEGFHFLIHVLEHGIDLCALCARPDYFTGSAFTENCIDRVDNNGFTCARFACQDIESASEFYGGTLDYRNIFNFQACKHKITSERYAPWETASIILSTDSFSSRAVASVLQRANIVSSPAIVPTSPSHSILSNAAQAAFAIPE